MVIFAGTKGVGHFIIKDMNIQVTFQLLAKKKIFFNKKDGLYPLSESKQNIDALFLGV